MLHLIDAYSDDVAAAYTTIRNELERYSPELVNRPEVIALTKCEGLDDEMIAMQRDTLCTVVSPSTDIFVISSQSHQGITEVLRALRVKVQQVRESSEPIKEDEPEQPVVISLPDHAASARWKVEYDDENSVYRVTGEKIEKFAIRTNYDQFESLNRLRDIMKRLGIGHELARMGARGDSMIQIGDSPQFTLVEQ